MSTTSNKPRSFSYQYDKGPLRLRQLRTDKLLLGNCRLAVQDYLFAVFQQYLPPHKILLPYSYHRVGKFITNNYHVEVQEYRPGDIIYAVRITTHNNKVADKKSYFKPTSKDWLRHLHTAVYVSKNKIYHATIIEGKTCYWSLKRFLKHYNIFAVKRILQ